MQSRLKQVLTLTIGNSNRGLGGFKGGQVFLGLHEALGGGLGQRLGFGLLLLSLHAIVAGVGGVLALLLASSERKGDVGIVHVSVSDSFRVIGNFQVFCI